MAFNFNWTPLAADTDFYKRAQDLLTGALNKTPKPPIIVDDIHVHEMNLGSVPPDLEILEIGDLAEDRFRGIFKMRYSGNAFLTLKTKVQANPLNTYLSTRLSSFGAPEPLAAASGLTIPLKITLSDIKLSAFIILVFSKQKGITLVFRNDPLESLKVSSTFDSISFVRGYLQKEIEGQLRILFMDQLPAIIHRLSLRLFVPEYKEKEDSELAKTELDPASEEMVKDPLASPPQDPVDLNGNVLDFSQIASLSLDSASEIHSLFSRKNLVQLATLGESNRTLSLFSPTMKDVVYRAYAGSMERVPSTGIQSPVGASLSRKQSHVAIDGAHTYTFLSGASDSGTHTSNNPRPLLPSQASYTSNVSSGFGKHKPGRKRKHRTINLRKPKKQTEDGEVISEEGSMSATMSSASSTGYPAVVPENRERDELITPPSSPGRSYNNLQDKNEFQNSPEKQAEPTPRPPRTEKQRADSVKAPARPLFEPGPAEPEHLADSGYFGAQLSDSTATIRPKPTRYFGSWQPPTDGKGNVQTGSSSQLRSHDSGVNLAAPFPYSESNAGGILEQAWMMKMAGEIARRVSEQKGADSRFWNGPPDGTPPPAYAS